MRALFISCLFEGEVGSDQADNYQRAVALLRRRLQDNQIYFYRAGLTKEKKADVDEWFIESNDGILTATCAYGMGVDKPNIQTTPP